MIETMEIAWARAVASGPERTTRSIRRKLREEGVRAVSAGAVNAWIERRADRRADAAPLC